jgi:hypothetical protein
MLAFSTRPHSNQSVSRHFLFLLFVSALSAETPRDLIEHYNADVSLLQRHWSITGDSSRSMDREQNLHQSWLTRLSKLDFASLSPSDQIDCILLRNELETALMHLHERRDIAQELNPWLPFRPIIAGLNEQRVHGDPLNVEQAATGLAPLAKAVTDLQNKLKKMSNDLVENENSNIIDANGSNEYITIFGKKVDLTRKQLVTIVLLSAFFFLTSSFYSLVLFLI